MAKYQIKNNCFFSVSADPTGPGPCAIILTGISALLIILTLPLSLMACVKVGRVIISGAIIQTLIGNYLIDQTPSQNNLELPFSLGIFLSDVDLPERFCLSDYLYSQRLL